MAIIAELYYLKKLPKKLESKVIDGVSPSYAYNLYGTYFSNYADLYDYNLQSDILKYTFGFSYFNESSNVPLKYLSNNSYIFNKIYKDEILNSNVYDIVLKDTIWSDKEMKDALGATFETYEDVVLNEDKIQDSDIIENDDKQILNAIYAAFIKQDLKYFYSSGSDLTTWLRKILIDEVNNTIFADGFINLLKTRLENKEAPVLISNYSGGYHAINAISLVQDKDNPNYYYIGVYDNNYPGEKRYVDVVCKNNVCLTKANSYYTESNQVLKLTPSLEYDLSYFK